MSGVTLAVAPEVYFSQLKKLAPQVKRVHVVYNPTISAWVIDFAKASARLAGVELLSYQSKNIKDSALLYRDILRLSKPMEDAIWLMPDASSVDDSVILPLILKEAWNRNLVVFSGNPAHAKRGALFSLYPDNVLMGKALARLALQRSNAQVEPGRDRLRPLRDVQAAINLRTADHLGLRLSSEQRRDAAVKRNVPPPIPTSTLLASSPVVRPTGVASPCSPRIVAPDKGPYKPKNTTAATPPSNMFPIKPGNVLLHSGFTYTRRSRSRSRRPESPTSGFLGAVFGVELSETLN